MLYGNDNIQNEIMARVNSVSSTNSFTSIYVGTVGSISRGIADKTSDYDVKALFIKSRLLDDEYLHVEDMIRYREFNPDVPYNCIAFWEVTAFFNFLAEPYIDKGYSYDLFHNVIWLINTPYAWDPLGLAMKVHEKVLECVDVGNEYIYHYSLLKTYIERAKIDIRYSARTLYECMALKWMDIKDSCCPISILNTLSISDTSEKELYNDIFDAFSNDNESVKNRSYELGQKYLHKYDKYMDSEYDFKILEKNKTSVNDIKCIITNTINREIEVDGVGKAIYL